MNKKIFGTQMRQGIEKKIETSSKKDIVVNKSKRQFQLGEKSPGVVRAV